MPSPPGELHFLEPTDAAGRIGRLGGYEVIEKTAQGAMGIVLRAEDPQLRREVAIKVLHPNLATDPAARRRFLREARAAAAIDHENVMPIFDVSRDENLPYFVMPFIDGDTLRERIERDGAMPVDEVRRIGTQIARGLSVAHAQSLIHRDIKPANIVLNRDGRALVADFGLARTTEGGDHTQLGGTTGTPHFMSPEQVEGDGSIDHRSDLFSLGSLLSYMATGQLPFDGESVLATLRKVVEAPPRNVADIPSSIAPTVTRLMEKRPRDRIQTADAVADSLGAGDAPSSLGRRRVGLVLACIAALVALAIAFPHLKYWIVGPNPDGLRFWNENARAGHDTLKDALAGAEPGETVWLHFTDEARLTPIELPPHGIALRAADGHAPVLIFDSHAPAIQASAPLWLEGLTLVGSKAVTLPQPIVQIRGAPLLINNCTLHRQHDANTRIRPTRGHLPALIHTEDCPELAVANSIIQSAKNHTGVHIATQSGAVPLDAEISNSAIFCQRSLTFNCDAKTTGEVTLDRTLFMAQRSISFERDSSIPPIAMSARQCAFDVLEGVLVWNDQLAKPGLEGFSWDGERNAFHTGHALAEAMPRPQKNRNLLSLEAWRTFFDTPETGTTTAAPVRQAFRVRLLNAETAFTGAQIAEAHSPEAKEQSIGNDGKHLGPGVALVSWRKSADGEAFAARAAKALGQ